MKLKRALLKIALKREANRLLSQLEPEEKKLIKSIRKKKLTYLPEKKLVGLVHVCNELKTTKIPGIIIEAGCALGGSSILIAKTKDPQRQLKVYDVFDMIPPPSKGDTDDVHKRYQTIVEGESKGIGGDKYYGYQDNLYDKVLSNFKDFTVDVTTESVTLIKGLVQDTLIVNEPVALAHVDVDWYDPVKTCLERIFPQLSIGGSIILDDYYAWGGCRKATDEYIQTIQGQYELDNSMLTMRLKRIA